jgi:chromate transporter
VLHQRYGALPLVQQALTGMLPVAVGLLFATVVKMATVLPREWRPWLFGMLAFVGVGVLRWPLLAVVGALAPFAIAAAWRGKD